MDKTHIGRRHRTFDHCSCGEIFSYLWKFERDVMEVTTTIATYFAFLEDVARDKT